MIRKEVGRPVERRQRFDERAHVYDVLDALGPPTRLSATSDGLVFLYEALQIRERQIGLGGQYDWFQLIKLSLANSDLRRDCVILHFNEEGVLVSQSRINTLEKLGMGGSIQPVLSLQQIVDTADYEDDAFVSMNWGISMLRPLPQTLNDRQNMNSGMAGVEQSGTTPSVGQHTPEMR
jgi:hypothetical protein